MTLDHIKAGPVGYAKYALEFPFKDKIICTDYARRKLKYKNEQGEIVSDPEGNKICKMFFSLTHDRNKELVDPYISELQHKLWNIPRECGDDLDEKEIGEYTYNMGIISTNILKLTSDKKQYKYCLDGQKTDLQYKFIKYICSQTVIK